jgi:hypothetical protein
MDNYNMLDQTNQEDQRDEPEYGYKRVKTPELEIIDKCRNCGHYLTSEDELYIDHFDVFCSVECSAEFEMKLESESA